MIIAHAQLELASLYYDFFGTKKIFPVIRYDLMGDWYKESGISIEWWIKSVSEDICSILTYGVIAFVLHGFSRKLSSVAFLFCGYHLFDHFMLWHNFRTIEWLYWLELLVDIIGVLFLIKIKDRSVVKSLV